jgi:hypothetical protein
LAVGLCPEAAASSRPALVEDQTAIVSYFLANDQEPATNHG